MAQPFAAKNNSLTCTNWLSLPSYQSYAQVGDLDIIGNHVTLEAVFIRTAPYSNGYNWAGDLVSKHVDPTDVNYLLRPNNAEITTSNGHFTTPPICEIALNQVYHAAMTYDGSTLKFYRNGFLMSSVPATGNLIQNNHQTRIGLYDANQWNTNLIGYINEVRIWNIVRTQSEIQTFMNSSLLNPASQPGLLAYYTFDNLQNKQGNATWNAALGGNAGINATNPNCNFIRDSCNVQYPLTGFINDYTPVISLDKCLNNILVENSASFSPGDTVMIMQMKGAQMDSNNSASFGTIADYKNAGNYEMNFIRSINGNSINLSNKLKLQYDLPYGKVQLIRVPYFSNLKATGITCPPWNGKTGGVLVINVADTLELLSDINVSGAGFKGGADPVTIPSGYNCYESAWYYPANPDLASGKGEAITDYSANISFGRGSPANGGGGGNSHNSGGGGGSNAGSGGYGGYNFEGDPCTNTPFDNRGVGGKTLNYSSSLNRIFLGGGGGAGHSNNPTGFQALGGEGGGIIVIIASRIKSNGKKIIANGADGKSCGGTDPTCHEGMGGGGGGGTVVINSAVFMDNAVIETNGGKGADMTASGFLRVGPGGGGGGGFLGVSNVTMPAAVNHVKNGGASGVATGYGNTPFGATPGAAGSEMTVFLIAKDDVPFKKNIDSVRIKDSLLSCDRFRFNGLAFTNGVPIVNWDWDFDDGNMAQTQNVQHNYPNPGTYSVKLRVTDANGCKDSSMITVVSSLLTVNAGADDTICVSGSVILPAFANGASSYSWTPVASLSDPLILNPVASPIATTSYYLTATNSIGCSQMDTVTITVRGGSSFTIDSPVNNCLGDSIQLHAGGGDLYSWSPAGSLDNPVLSSPLAYPRITTVYTVTITDTLCGFTRNLSTTVNILPLPLVRATRSNDIDCSQPKSILSAVGARSYLWSPATTLNNPLISSPIASPIQTTTYLVKGTDQFGCKNEDSVKVMVSNVNRSGNMMATAFTPNNDGLNDCYGIKYWGNISKLEFSIFNRWGQRIFYSTDPSACWDGKFQGIPQNPAIFIYMIKATTVCDGEVFRKGTFALIR